MKSFLTLIVIAVSLTVTGQEFINGDFEDNTAVGDNLGLTNFTFNSMMDAAVGFGTLGNIDILTTTVWLSSGPQNGNWFVGLTGGGSDKMSIELDSPFISGQSYTIRFYDSKYQLINANLLSIGISNTASSIGTEIYETTSLPIAASWTEREFTFTAPFDASYITVQHIGGTAADWVAVDNFQVLCDVSVDLGPNINTCEGEEVLLNAGLEGATYEWQDGSTDSIFNVSETGLYTVTVETDICSFSDAVIVSFVNYPIIDLTEEILACDGDVVEISPSTDVLIVDYEWSTGDSAQNIVVEDPGMYVVNVSNLGCVSTDSVEVVYNSFPDIELGEDALYCVGENVIINTGTSDLEYEWQDGSTDENYVVTEPGIYSVSASNQGCISEDQIEISFEICDVFLELPNIFTPNNDDLNALFQPILSVNIYELDFELYNRWGNLIFETDDLEILWDGKMTDGGLVPSGTYYYIVTYKNQIGDGEMKSGNVTILRD